MAGRSDYRKILLWAGGIVTGLVLLAAGAAYVSIESAVDEAQKRAAAQFPGRDPAQALIEVVDCEKCHMEQRDRAVWTLGQMREERALAVLHKHFYDGRCNHAKFICQYELRKALKRIEAAPPVHARR